MLNQSLVYHDAAEKTDVLTVGSITLDHIFKLDRLPTTHFEANIDHIGTYFGGRAPNVAVMLAKLGFGSGIVSPVGSGFRESGYEAHLAKLGVNLQGIVRVPSERMMEVWIHSDRRGNQTTVLNVAAARHFGKMHVPSALIKKSRIVHISSSGDYKFNVAVARSAVELDVPVSFDVGNDPSTEISRYVSSMIRNSTFVFVNNVELSGVLKRVALRSAHELLSIGPSTIVVMDKFDKSSWIYTNDGCKRIRSPLRKRKLVDNTGASDAYVAGFLAGQLKGWCQDFRTCGLLGAAEASFVTESLGCQTNLPSWEDLVRRIRVRFKCRIKSGCKD